MGWPSHQSKFPHKAGTGIDRRKKMLWPQTRKALRKPGEEFRKGEAPTEEQFGKKKFIVNPRKVLRGDFLTG